MNRPFRGRPSRGSRKPNPAKRDAHYDSRTSSVSRSRSDATTASTTNNTPTRNVPSRGSERLSGESKQKENRNNARKVPNTLTVLYSRNMSPQRNSEPRQDSSFWDDEVSNYDDESSDFSDEDPDDDVHCEDVNNTTTAESNEQELKRTVFFWDLEGCPVPDGFTTNTVISRLLEISQKAISGPPRVICLLSRKNQLSKNLETLEHVEVIICEADEIITCVSVKLKQLVDFSQKYKVYLIGFNEEINIEDFKNCLEIVHIKNHSKNACQHMTFQELLDNKQKSSKVNYSYFQVDAVTKPSDIKKFRGELRKILKSSWCKFSEGKAFLRFPNLSLAEEMAKKDALSVLFGKEIFGKILTEEEAQEYLKKLNERHQENLLSRRKKQTKIKQCTLKVRFTGKMSEAELKEKLLEFLEDDCFTITEFKSDAESSDNCSTQKIISTLTVDGKIKASKISNALKGLTKTSSVKEVETYLEEANNKKNKSSGLHLLEAVDRCRDDLSLKRIHAEEEKQKKMEDIEIAIKKAKESNKEDHGVILMALSNKREELNKQLQEFKKFSDNFFEKLKNIKMQNLSRSRVNDLRLAFACEIQRLQEALPIYAAKSEILDAVIDNQVIILLAETGSGKSTQLVQYLLQTNIALNGVIACTQPRRIAASSLATHVAHQMLSNVGQTVGYRVGLTNRSNKSTKIIYMTDQSLLSEILEDPDLKKYSCIIVDEAHERSIYTDLLIAMIKRCLQRRSDLKVVITSATIDPKLFVKYFGGCPVLRVPGRTFPVKIMWSKHNTIHTEHDYVKAAVAVVLQIHTKDAFKERGDVLVFLTGVAEIETAIQLMECQPEDIKNSLIILPLHGKLQPDQQNKVFETTPRGKRKVVFATNIAETSVTIPGIKYVVDCGYMKEIQFDPKRNLSSLTLRIISQSSAEQRKGRAGRMEPGFCYRMYSEEDFNSFDGIQRPELLRVNLEQAVLKLLELGITNLKEFDFVEAPSSESLETAISALENLEAIINGRITELGLKMSKLSIIPHLAKLILNGIEKDIGFEALIIAACATVSNNVFFRSGTDEEKANADKKKTLFCLPDGDFLTQLAVYKEWLEVNENQKTSWCLEKKINGRALKMSRDTINEFNIVIKKELGQPVKMNFSTSNNTNIILRRLIFESYFKNNLCLSYGPQQAGYFHLYTEQRVHIHPSSALYYLGRITPKFIVYNQLLKTSRTFTIGVTPVDEEWVKQMINEKKLNVDWDFLQNLIIQPKVFHPIGPALMAKILIGKENTKRKELEKKLTQTLGEEIVTDASIARGEFIVYASSHLHEKIEGIIRENLKQEKEFLSSQIQEKYYHNSNLRMLFGCGGEAQNILYPEDFCEVSVNLNPKTTSKEVLDVLSSYGKIVSHFEHLRPPKKLFVLYQSPKHAKEAVNNKTFNVMPRHKIRNSNTKKHFLRMKILWSRRPNKGFGFIEPQNVDDLSMAMSTLRHNSSTFIFDLGIPTVDLDKKTRSKIYLKDLQRDLSNEMFKSQIIEIFRTRGIHIRDAFVIPTDPFPATKKDHELMEKRLNSILGRFVSLSEIKLHLLQRNPKSTEWLAFVDCEDPEIVQKIIKAVHLKETIEGQRLFVKIDLNSTLYCDREIFDAIKDFLPSICKNFTEKLSHQKSTKKLEITTEDVDQNRKAIRIVSDNIVDASMANFVISKLLNGTQMEFADSSQLRSLMTATGRKYLKSIMSETSTLIIACNRRLLVTLYGNPEKIKQATERIKVYLEKIQIGFEEKTISLLGEDKPRGLIKRLLQKYGCTLKGLQQETGVETLHLDLYQHNLLVFGTSEAIKMVHIKLEEFISSIKSKPESSISTTPSFTVTPMRIEECPVCLTAVDVSSSTAHFRLQLCGHSYCWECVEGLVGSRTFPLKCIYENCNELFCIKDLQIISKQFEKIFADFDSLALENLVKKHPDKYGYCITPNCKGIYSSAMSKFMCVDCKNEICTSCRVQYHHGFSCDVYQMSKEDEDYPLKVWMNSNKTERSYCPSCSVPIEKIEGCSYMKCTQCSSNFCWKCKQIFSSESHYSQHQPNCI